MVSSTRRPSLNVTARVGAKAHFLLLLVLCQASSSVPAADVEAPVAAPAEQVRYLVITPVRAAGAAALVGAPAARTPTLALALTLTRTLTPTRYGRGEEGGLRGSLRRDTPSSDLPGENQ